MLTILNSTADGASGAEPTHVATLALELLHVTLEQVPAVGELHFGQLRAGGHRISQCLSALLCAPAHVRVDVDGTHFHDVGDPDSGQNQRASDMDPCTVRCPFEGTSWNGAQCALRDFARLLIMSASVAEEVTGWNVCEAEAGLVNRNVTPVAQNDLIVVEGVTIETDSAGDIVGFICLVLRFLFSFEIVWIRSSRCRNPP